MRKELYIMDKEKLKKGLGISLIIGLGLALAITYFFLLYGNESIVTAVADTVLVLRPFIIGAVIAYILKSTCNGYEKGLLKLFAKRKNADHKKDASRANVIAVILTYLTWAIALGALLVIAVPQIVDSITIFIEDLVISMPSYIDTVKSWIETFKEKYPDVSPYVDEAGNAIVGWLSEDLAPQLPELGSTLVQGVLDVFNVLKDFVIGIIISVFILAGRKVFARKSTLLVKAIFKEKQANAIINETRFADKMFGGFLEGKIIDSTIIGTIYFIALVIMDIRYAALLALICGITNIIPFFGPFIGAVPSGLIILMSNEDPLPKLLYFIIFVCVIQFIDGYFIDPHIVGGHIKMSPFAVIFAVLLFGGLWGFGGLLIGVPTFAVIYDIFRKTIFHHLRKNGKKDILRKYLEETGRVKPNPEKATVNEAADAPTTEPEAASAEVVSEKTNSDQ